MLNIAELLKDAQKGMKLYSPLFGEVKFVGIDKQSGYPIDVTDCKGNGKSFTEFGVYFADHPDAECLLFPSKECRTWENFKLVKLVKPNFKVGDWVVHDMSDGRVSPPRQIIALTDKSYILDGECFNSFYFKDLEESFRKWTIQDAKDGDVLVLNGKPFIYSHKYGKNYCYIDDCGQFRVNFSLVLEGNCVLPATKEQRDLLFKKMKEAGYEWDEKKKELRKIQSHYDIDNFHAGMPVLVRDKDNRKWCYLLYSHYDNTYEDGLCFNAGSVDWRQCIPFNKDTEHLLGTTDMPSEEYINW